MMKPSEYLKATGWKPIRADAKPRETGWQDPDGQGVVDFITAIRIQAKRDEKAQS
jgi:hypothetical protein